VERPERERGDQWATLISVAGAAGASVGLVYAIGGVVLGFRYEGFGLSSHTVTVTPREQLLLRGGVAMTVWTVLGLILVLALETASRRLNGSFSAVTYRAVALGLAAVAVVLLLVLHVWWPLLAVGAVGVAFVTSRWRSRPVVRFLACAVAVGAVAVAYEADRLRFIVERTCVDYSRPSGRVCGILIGQTDRGIYLGETARQDRSSLILVPANRVQWSTTVRTRAAVIESQARARRRPIRSRLLHLDIR
jgi:hypothetical protein